MDIPIETTFNDVKIKQINSNEAVRILGIYMAPNLKWCKQYKIMKDKMRKVVSKFKNTSIHQS